MADGRDAGSADAMSGRCRSRQFRGTGLIEERYVRDGLLDDDEFARRSDESNRVVVGISHTSRLSMSQVGILVAGSLYTTPPTCVKNTLLHMLSFHLVTHEVNFFTKHEFARRAHESHWMSAVFSLCHVSRWSSFNTISMHCGHISTSQPSSVYA